jgi:hypothetical protein
MLGLVLLSQHGQLHRDLLLSAVKSCGIPLEIVKAEDFDCDGPVQ